ncbi:small ribosomal subunit protein cS22 [Silene latifolia]|uniref:small ribosomal subunit protein cS22 n=1 Tax=Silene latifolia TaxID=37657 RepID=UPI003D76D3D1
MATISSFITCPTLVQPNSTSSRLKLSTKTHLQIPVLCNGYVLNFKTNVCTKKPQLFRVHAVATEETTTTTTTSSSSNDESAKRVYIGNIPRNVNNDELRRIVEEHGAVEKAEVMYDKWSGRSRRFAFATMKTVEDANAVVEKLNDTEIGGRKIKVNITEKPLGGVNISAIQGEDTQFVDSPHKVYVGNLAKTVTTEMLKEFFSGKGTVLSAKVQRTPGTSKSSGFGFVCFSSEEEVEAAITALNNAALEGQKIRVNKA